VDIGPYSDAILLPNVEAKAEAPSSTQTEEVDLSEGDAELQGSDETELGNSTDLLDPDTKIT